MDVLDVPAYSLRYPERVSWNDVSRACRVRLAVSTTGLHMRMQHSWLLLAGLLLCGRQISEGAGQAGSPTVENFLFNAQVNQTCGCHIPSCMNA